MNDQQRAAMTLALEALNEVETFTDVEADRVDEAITALRSALADSAAFSSEALSEPPTTEELIQHRYEDHQLNGEAK